MEKKKAHDELSKLNPSKEYPFYTRAEMVWYFFLFPRIWAESYDTLPNLFELWRRWWELYLL